jgi:hypothetical protein
MTCKFIKNVSNATLESFDLLKLHKVTVHTDIHKKFFIYRLWQPSVGKMRGMIHYSKVSFDTEESQAMLFHYAMINALDECIKHYIQEVYFEYSEDFESKQIIKTSAIVELDDILKYFNTIFILYNTEPLPKGKCIIS